MKRELWKLEALFLALGLLLVVGGLLEGTLAWALGLPLSGILALALRGQMLRLARRPASMTAKPRKQPEHPLRVA